MWRKETFLAMLAQMGVSDEELAEAAEVAEAREEALSRLSFQAAVKVVPTVPAR